MKSGWWWMNFINYQWKMKIQKWISSINKDVNNDHVGDNFFKTLKFLVNGLLWNIIHDILTFD